MRLRLLSLVALSGLGLGGCVNGDWGLHAQAATSESRPLAKDGRFELENTNGRVEISAWDESKVSIEATKRAASERRLDDIRIEISGEGDSVRVRTRYPRAHLFGGGGRVDYVVRVPRTARVRVAAVNGHVEVAGVSGEVAASTVNGSVDVHDAAGAVDASSVNGGVEVALAQVDPQGHSSIHTTNGSVRLTLPADAGAEIEARTVNGGVSCDFQLASETRSKRRLEGRIGAGGGRFELRSVNGSVSVDRGLAAHAAAERKPAEAAPESKSR
jgi:putative adhesin